MTSNRKCAVAAVLIGAALLADSVAAGEIGRNLRQGRSADGDTDNHVEVGAGLGIQIGPRLRERDADDSDQFAVLLVNGRYQWGNGLFIESFAEDENGLALGFQAYTGDAWSLDLMLTPKHLGGTAEGEVGDLRSRSDLAATARASGYVGNYLWQVQGWRDVIGRHDGFGASALFGRHWQVRNWNLHAMAGAAYTSADANNYYYGVSGQQAAQTGLAEFESGSGLRYSAEVGATYPLGRRWVMRSTLRLSRLPGEVADSSRLDGHDPDTLGWMTSISYVF